MPVGGVTELVVESVVGTDVLSTTTLVESIVEYDVDTTVSLLMAVEGVADAGLELVVVDTDVDSPIEVELGVPDVEVEIVALEASPVVSKVEDAEPEVPVGLTSLTDEEIADGETADGETADGETAEGNPEVGTTEVGAADV